MALHPKIQYLKSCYLDVELPQKKTMQTKIATILAALNLANGALLNLSSETIQTENDTFIGEHLLAMYDKDDSGTISSIEL